MTPACLAAERLFYFVDERGVPHFSNVPEDARYRPLDSAITLLAAREPRASAGLGLVLTGPAEHVRRGQRVEVSITLPGSQNMRGLVELRFDPAALDFDEASTDAYLAGPGRLRLEMEPGIASVFEAAVMFRATAAAFGRTRLSGAVVELEDEERRGVAVQPASPIEISLAP
jgi:hypothetical protein